VVPAVIFKDLFIGYCFKCGDEHFGNDARIAVVFLRVKWLIVLLDNRHGTFSLEQVDRGEPLIEVVVVRLVSDNVQVLLIKEAGIGVKPLPGQLRRWRFTTPEVVQDSGTEEEVVASFIPTS
jgi:hypothetical protein